MRVGTGATSWSSATTRGQWSRWPGLARMQQIWMQIQKRQSLPSPRVSTKFDVGGQDLAVCVDEVGWMGFWGEFAAVSEAVKFSP